MLLSSGIAQLEFLSVALDRVTLRLSVSLRSSAHVESLSFAFDLAHLGLSLLPRSSGCFEFALVPFGVSRLSTPSLILDLAH